jgi:SAM-dependent methyltransferase
MSPERTDSGNYWDQRLVANLNLRGTGHRAFDLEYNRWMYQAQRDCFESLIERHDVTIAGQRVLDIGSGTGFFVQAYQQHHAAELFGVDISQTSIEYLRKTFPTGHFAVCDISAADFPFDGPFDVVSAISVLYHIIDDGRFESALSNICRLLTEGGFLFLSDTFRDPLLPTARHARMRPLAYYQTILEQHGVKTLEILPLYYLLNRSFVPFVAPRIISFFRLGRVFYRLDSHLRQLGTRNLSGMKLLLAQKAPPST